MISAETKLCYVIGYPVQKSLSPVIHNAGLKKLGLESDFVCSGLNLPPKHLEKFVALMRDSNIRGCSVTLPHKQAIIPILDALDNVAKEIGAVNCIVNDSGKLTGYNVDWIGAIEPLKNLLSLKNKRVAVIGAGGAAKAFVYGLSRESANITVFNRTKKDADDLAAKFGCGSASLDEIEMVKDFDIICNASSIGFRGSNQDDVSPVPKEFIYSNQIVFDAVYSPIETELIKSAEQARAKIIPGIEMLLHQGFAQFELFFKAKAPKDEMKKALMEYLK